MDTLTPAEHARHTHTLTLGHKGMQKQAYTCTHHTLKRVGAMWRPSLFAAHLTYLHDAMKHTDAALTLVQALEDYFNQGMPHPPHSLSFLRVIFSVEPADFQDALGHRRT